MTKTRTDHDCASEKAHVIVSKQARPLHPVVKGIADNLAGIDAYDS